MKFRYVILFAAAIITSLSISAQSLNSDGRNGSNSSPNSDRTTVIKPVLPLSIPLSDNDDPAKDSVVNDDLVVIGNLGAGTGMLNGYSFNYKTICMRANNVRLYFDDNSVGSFPANDWMIEANSTISGGASYLAIRDSTNGTLPFIVAANAPDTAFVIEASTGDIGIGTAAPVLDLHILRGDTPGFRLDQDASLGWTAQAWDIAGNETNFFIRDVTHSSHLPFRIAPGAPTSSLSIGSTGNIGLGTWTPSQKLEVIGAMRLKPSFTPTTLNSGTMFMDTTDHLLKYYDGTQWNTVSPDTDEQDLTAATLTGTILQIDIENGSSVSVDLAPLLADLEARVSALELLLGVKTNESGKNYLLQNAPNPFTGETSIAYFISPDVTNASLVIYDVRGAKIKEMPISNRGEGNIHIAAGDLNIGTFFYSLILDGQKTESKILVKVE